MKKRVKVVHRQQALSGRVYTSVLAAIKKERKNPLQFLMRTMSEFCINSFSCKTRVANAYTTANWALTTLQQNNVVTQFTRVRTKERTKYPPGMANMEIFTAILWRLYTGKEDFQTIVTFADTSTAPSSTDR